MVTRTNALFFRAAFLLICSTVAANLANAQDFDRVRTNGKSESGKIVGMDHQKVTLSKGSSGERSIPINTITEIRFAREPDELTTARLNAATGGYRNALDALSAVDDAAIDRAEISEDILFYNAYCTARLALGGEGDLLEAGKGLGRFVKSHKNNFHYYEATETIGDVLVALGKYAAAEKQYAKLAETPWDNFKLKANVLQGRALAAQAKHADAIVKFDTALSILPNEKTADALHLDATLGKAVSLAESGKNDQAVGMIYDVITRAKPEASMLHATAYNALGRCHLKAGNKKDALLAFLHVDVLYSGHADAHAEALGAMIPLWDAVGQTARAQQARNTLSERYPNSRWTKE